MKSAGFYAVFFWLSQNEISLIFAGMPFLKISNTNAMINRRAPSETGRGWSAAACKKWVTSSPGGGDVNNDMTGMNSHGSREKVRPTEIIRWKVW